MTAVRGTIASLDDLAPAGRSVTGFTAILSRRGLDCILGFVRQERWAPARRRESSGMKNSLLGGLIAATLVMQGCATTMNENECVHVDWQTVGYEDGARGEPAHRLGQHRRACAEHGVVPDLEAYQAGRRQGLQEFCQPANGFAVGASGRVYAGSCPTQLEEDFLVAYKAGRKLHDLESRLSNLNSQIAYHDRAIAQADQELTDKQSLVISDDATVSERAQALFVGKDIAERKDKLEDERKLLVKDRDRVKRRLEKYRNSLAYNF
jgi:hypothetical protein